MLTKLAGAAQGVVNGRWRLERRVGAGADATLFAATDLRDGSAVALKALHATLGHEARQRLRWEFAALAAVAHPHLVRVFDLELAAGEGPLAAGQPFFTSELCLGTPPPTRLAALPPEARARALLQLLAEVASALEALHRRGLVHHDVKPSNLLADARGRTRLGDLGLAALRGARTGARGTPAYLAPEALDGVSDARVDLYALGATAYELWSGRPPFSAASLAELLRVDAPPPPLGDVPEELGELVLRLLARAPAARPSSARALLDEALRLGARLDGELDGGRLARAPVVCPPALVGREAELSTLLAALGQARLILVEGGPGSGRTRLVDEARRAQQLEDTRLTRAARPWRSLGSEAALAVAQELAQAAAPVVLHVASVADPRVEELLALAANGACAPSLVVAEVEPGARPHLDGEGVVRIVLPPLDEPAVTRLVRSMLGECERRLGRAVQRASGGQPRLAAEIVRAAVARAGAQPTANDVGSLDARDLATLISAGVAALPSPARTLVATLAVVGRAAALDELAALAPLDGAAAFAAARLARAAGLVDGNDAALRFPSPAHAHAAYAGLSPRRLQAMHRRALAAATGDARLVDRARHLVALEEPAAAAAALAAGRKLAAAGELRAAVRLLDDGTRLARGRLRAELLLAAAETRTQLGDYAAALAALATVEKSGHAGVRAAAALAAARVLQRRGELAAAESRLRSILSTRLSAGGDGDGSGDDSDDDSGDGSDDSGGDGSSDGSDEARGLLGRILVARGAYDEAATVCAGPTRHAAVAEARGLACLYLARLDDASTAFAAVERAAGDHVPSLARARSLAGMVAQAREQLPEAAAAYESALALARQAGDLHGAAIYAQNLGTVLREQAEYERALAPTAEAARDLGRLGKRAERAFALYNYGNLLLSIADLDGAARACAEAESVARAVAATRELGYAQLLAGDVARRRGDLAPAVAAYRLAAATLAAAGPRDRLFPLLNLAEAAAEAGDAATARRSLADAHALAHAANLVDMWLVSAVRVALQQHDPIPGAQLALLADTAERAARARRRELAFRAHLLLARAGLRDGDAHALSSLVQARTLYQEIRMRTPELRRDAAADDPEVRRLRELLGAAESATASGGNSEPANRVGSSVETLRRLLAINKRLNSELRLPRLLELILDTVLELTSAERGFILLRDDKGQWQVKAARNIAPDQLLPPTESSQSPRGGQLPAGAFSRSIAERAAREGLPIVTLDAAGDARFEAALSVSDLKLRSVLAVPLIVKGQVVGCVYADHRVRAGAFGDADVSLVCDLAEQAAIAVENARLIAENERRRRAIDELNKELERKVASQAVELGELHKEVRSSRVALSVRYNYDNLVGRTPRMMELFRLLDRVTDTALPVVIYGESGTGKELVARAIHHNGPRRDKPFVSESCAAIPETLLEAALFGHVRGAFTGADAERRGLFEVADGGTLFLDEVGEMSPAMQVKLLRVLQQGEFRRVGGEKTLKVDVRVLVASNRDLGRLVEEGKFREDLFYRLNVVRVGLPPLRERRDDIPLLVEHFLRKFAEENKIAPKKIARAALHKLIGYRWPGNVRELENEVVRASSLGGELIDVADLSPQVAAGTAEAAVDSPDDLGLKSRVERLERILLREALARADGNQTQAAKLLGLSRFGLQKKLSRYGLDA